ncbi:hypothetical protein KPP03845_100096 [Streptomyces xanthophaeus]|nr:hypothetical protein KPP03845_100096 [Streptomyces xanthophaeus]
MDLERGVEVDPDDLSCRFEKLMCDTVQGGLESCAEQWKQLLVSPMTPPDEGDTRFSDLFRALLLEPENRVAEATEGLIATQPGLGNIRRYVELSG